MKNVFLSVAALIAMVASNARAESVSLSTEVPAAVEAKANSALANKCAGGLSYVGASSEVEMVDQGVRDVTYSLHYSDLHGQYVVVKVKQWAMSNGADDNTEVLSVVGDCFQR